MKLEKLVKYLCKYAPESLAMSWDNVGLTLGSKSSDIKKIMLALTVDDEVVDSAIEKKVDLIISHHPLIFNPLKSVIEENPTEKIIRSLIKNDIAVYVMHTNLDVVPGGVSDALADYVGLDMDSLKVIKQTAAESLFKIVTFVPLESTDKVRDSLFSAGAGHIGNYSDCSFNIEGNGTFKPLDGSDPYIGKKDVRESVSEQRIETIVPQANLDKVVNALIKNHPYEEVAYDIYPVTQKGTRFGFGKWGKLRESATISGIVQKTGAVLKGLEEDREINTIAVCGGSGADLINSIARLNTDVLLTGDIKYHDEVLAKSLGITLLDMGHYNSEIHVLPFIESYLKKIYHNEANIIIYK